MRCIHGKDFCNSCCQFHCNHCNSFKELHALNCPDSDECKLYPSLISAPWSSSLQPAAKLQRILPPLAPQFPAPRPLSPHRQLSPPAPTPTAQFTLLSDRLRDKINEIIEDDIDENFPDLGKLAYTTEPDLSEPWLSFYRTVTGNNERLTAVARRLKMLSPKEIQDLEEKGYKIISLDEPVAWPNGCVLGIKLLLFSKRFNEVCVEAQAMMSPTFNSPSSSQSNNKNGS